MPNPRGRSQSMKFLAFLSATCMLLCALASATPSITLSKKTGPPTSRILVSGRGFAPNTGVDIFFHTRDRALVVTNGKGEFRDATIYVPRGARPGKHWVTALERNNDKGAQEPFLVQTEWSQFHFDSDGTRLNPYENVLSPKNVGNLQLKWTFSTGQGVTSSAAVVDGVVYIGGYYSWTFYALNAYTGAQLWNYDTDGLVISLPAVEKGVVYFGSGDNNVYAMRADTGATVWIHTANGSVYPSPVVVDGSVFMGSYDQQNIFALNASTGAVLWSVTADGPVYSSPAVANGVVYIGSEYPGTSLFALNAKTGASLWTYTLGESGMDSSPAISNGVVYVCFNGNLNALGASTGTLLWSYANGGTVSSPAVANGVVYIGGSSVYALDADTGALRWSYAIQGGVLSSPVVANGVVYVGGYDYNVYALDADTGAKLWSYRTNNAIYSSPAVANGMVYIGSDDGNVYAFGLPRDDESKENAAFKRPAMKALAPDFSLKALKTAASKSGDEP